MTHHQKAHLALAVVYVVTAAVFLAEAAFAHAACAALAAPIYALLTWPPRGAGRAE